VAIVIEMVVIVGLLGTRMVMRMLEWRWEEAWRLERKWFRTGRFVKGLLVLGRFVVEYLELKN